MAITINGITYRNLEEQVLYNKEQIAALKESAGFFGTMIIGHVSSVANLPAASTYAGDLGSAYIVGSSEPYDLYIFVHDDDSDVNTWFKVGKWPGKSTNT